MKDRNAWLRFCFASDIDSDLKSSGGESVDGNGGAGIAGIEAIAVDTPVNEVSVKEMNKRKRSLASKLGIDIAAGDSAARILESGECAEEGEVEEELSCGGEEDGDIEEVEEVEFPDTNQALRCYTQGAMPAWTGAQDVPPSTTLLLQLDQVLTQKVLGYLVDFLQDRYAVLKASYCVLYAPTEDIVCSSCWVCGHWFPCSHVINVWCFLSSGTA